MSNIPIVRTFDQLQVRVYPDQPSLAADAAADAARILAQVIQERGQANFMVATGNAGLQFMAALRGRPDIEWSKINLFHMDEYEGIAAGHSASFRRFIHENLSDAVQPGNAYYIEGDALDAEAECQRYTELLLSHPIDLCHCGIGENGHLAFNDPPVADFNDPRVVKIVELDQTCRQQQVGEGHFPNLDAVPKHALTVTVSGLLRAKRIICVVPEARKQKAIYHTLLGPIHTSCPASILRRQTNATLYLDRDSARLLM